MTNYLKQEPGQGSRPEGLCRRRKVQDYAKTAMSWAVAEGFFVPEATETAPLLRPKIARDFPYGPEAQMAKVYGGRRDALMPLPKIVKPGAWPRLSAQMIVWEKEKEDSI